ncbi:hypothetical protein LCGC14_1874230 [marine sediment metagenome]|uniref:Uncharacterized protein n=1 Tax=marine sediment metagenome TaxID=412755 RepID=A0A0F9J2T8_9ZZZZ
MIMENPYGDNVNPSQHAAWEHGHTAAKAEQAEIVSGLVGYFVSESANYEQQYLSGTNDSARGSALGKCDAFTVAATKLAELL